MLSADPVAKMSSSISDSALSVNQLPISLEFSKDSERFHEALNAYVRRVANVMNTKEGGLYSLAEQYSFSQYYISIDPTSNNPIFKNVYRTTYDMVALNGGSIAAGTTFSTPHNIPLPTPTSLLNGTRIFGSATNSDLGMNGPQRLPLPYASNTANNNIEIYFDNVNVTIIVGAAQSALTYCTIVLEYTKT
jgi:hypothetical protein